MAEAIRLRALQLYRAGPDTLGLTFSSLLPFDDVTMLTDGEILHRILCLEFGATIVHGLSLACISPEDSRSSRGRMQRARLKLESVSAAEADHLARRQAWPSTIPQNVVLERLSDYYVGTQWTEPPVCAVCSRYERSCVTVELASDDFFGYHLDLLRITDPFIIRACIVQSVSASFAFGHDALDGLMLHKAGVEFDAVSGAAVGVKICCHCRCSLAKTKVPRLALANDLYRGSLPDQFRDLTWVEEKVCALYCITAHVTRLFQSSDPAQPRVFHGNTCAHEMNSLSTAAVLPRTPADVNGFLSVVFIGPEKFDPKRFGSLFRVRKQKIWDFLVWLRHHNVLYAKIPLDSALMDVYPDDGPIPGLDSRVVEDNELDADHVFRVESAGLSEHPATLFGQCPINDSDEQTCMIEKTGVSDPESVRLPGRAFVASAIRNLLPRGGPENRPDLVIHHGEHPVTEYNNPSFFPGLFPTLFPFGLGGFEIKTRQTALAFKNQANVSP